MVLGKYWLGRGGVLSAILYNTDGRKVFPGTSSSSSSTDFTFVNFYRVNYLPCLRAESEICIL